MISIIVFLLSLSTFFFLSESSCTSIEYLDPSTGTCQPCDSSCKTCFGPLKNHCSSCLGSMTMQNSTCLCPAKQYFQQNSTKCKTCHSQCTIGCTGSGIGECSICQPNTFLYQNNCYNNCLATEYFDTTSLSCTPCNPSCFSCAGPSSTECTTYSYTESLDFDVCDDSCLTCSGSAADQCLSCTSDMELTGGKCIPKAYSGVCDTSCLTCSGPDVDECLSCPSGATPTNARCMSVILKTQQNLSVSARSTANPSKFILSFGVPITDIYSALSSQIAAKITFQEKQPPLEYKYSLSLAASQTEIIIQLTYNGYLLASNVLGITLPDTVEDTSTIFMLEKDHFEFALPEYYKYSESVQKAIETVSQATQVTAQTNAVYSLISSTVFKSLHSIRSELIDSMLNYFIFMDIDFPPNFIEFAQGNLAGSDGIIPNIFSSIASQADVQNDDQVNDEDQTTFDRYLPSNAFFINFGNNLTLIIVIISVMGFVEVLLLLVSKKFNDKKLITKALAWLSFSLRWNTIVSEIISGFQESSLATMVSLRYSINTVDSTGAGIFLSFLVLGLIFACVFGRKVFSHHKNFEKIENKQLEDIFKRFAVLHDSLKPTNFRNFLFFAFLLLRSFGFSICLIAAQRTPIVQLVYMMITTLAFIVFLIRCAPIKKRHQLIMTILYELLLMTSIITALILYNFNQDNINDIETRTKMGFVLIGVSASMTILNIANFFVEILELYNDFKAKKKISVVPIIPTKIPLHDQESQRLSLVGLSASNTPVSEMLEKGIRQKSTLYLKHGDGEDTPNQELIISQRLNHLRRESSENMNMNLNQKLSCLDDDSRVILKVNSSRNLLKKNSSELKSQDSQRSSILLATSDTVSPITKIKPISSNFRNLFRFDNSETPKSFFADRKYGEYEENQNDNSTVQNNKVKPLAPSIAGLSEIKTINEISRSEINVRGSFETKNIEVSSTDDEANNIIQPLKAVRQEIASKVKPRQKAYSTRQLLVTRNHLEDGQNSKMDHLKRIDYEKSRGEPKKTLLIVDETSSNLRLRALNRIHTRGVIEIGEESQ